MKPNSRIQLAATLSNGPDGLLHLHVADFDGGVYSLQAQTDDDAVVLPNPLAPRYEVAISGSNPRALKRLANALQTLARNQENADNGDEAPAEDDDSDS